MTSGAALQRMSHIAASALCMCLDVRRGVVEVAFTQPQVGPRRRDLWTRTEAGSKQTTRVQAL